MSRARSAFLHASASWYLTNKAISLFKSKSNRALVFPACVYINDSRLSHSFFPRLNIELNKKFQVLLLLSNSSSSWRNAVQSKGWSFVCYA